jgi:ABC-type transport system substrate-binding protein
MTSEAISEIDRIDYFEQLALRRVDDFIKKTAAGALDTDKGLARSAVVQAAEKAIRVILRFHEAARDTSGRNASAWSGVVDPLRQKLVGLQIERLQTLADANDWTKARDLAVQIVQPSGNDEVRGAAAEQLGRMVHQSLREQNYPETRDRLRVLEETFPDTKIVGQIREELRRKAQELFDRAQGLEKKDRGQARQLTADAERIWPNLPRLHDYRLRLDNSYPVLGVGVRSLPVNMSPATAYTDSERQAVELIFDSLVKVTVEADGSQSYAPDLADKLPRYWPLVRSFRLIHDAKWSNGQPVTGADVRETVNLLRKPDWVGFSPEWTDIVEGPLSTRDPYQVSLHLSRGVLEPLSFMTFKILPAASPELLSRPGFAQHPIGSGPYEYSPGQKGDEFVFKANQEYHRADKLGMPYIREIHFFHSQNMVEDFRQGRLHLLLDLPTDKLQALGSVEDLAPPLTLRNRRVYFLAVNHRVPRLQNVDLRKAIAHAIDRKRILDDVFRSSLKGSDNPPHRVLNGPFPPDCWASDKGLTDLYDPLLARARADAAHPAVGPASFRLKYPDDDEDVRKACEAIRDQLKVFSIFVDLQPRTPHELHQEVEVDHDYDLAYYHFDYPDERYWLWPLFNPESRGSRSGDNTDAGNYLGYKDDTELDGKFREAMGHRDFAQVQLLSHQIHQLIHSKLPLIPLWQLDTHIAYHKDLRLPAKGLDPLLVFTEVEKWKLQKR